MLEFNIVLQMEHSVARHSNYNIGKQLRQLYLKAN